MAKLVKAGVCKTLIAGSSPAVASHEHQSYPTGVLLFLGDFHRPVYNISHPRYPLTQYLLGVVIGSPIPKSK